MTLREQLMELAEPAYRDFAMPLMPGVENVLGIRIPALRRIAREIVRGDWREFVASAQIDYFEERMLLGLVVGYARCPLEEKLALVRAFIPRIDNWAVCDSFCWHLKAEEREAMWTLIQPYFTSEAEYDVRFAVVMGLGNFIDREHLEPLLVQLSAVRHEGYYARMAVAWAVSICYVKFQERMLPWLETCTLDDWTYNKALQKIVESLRVDAAEKQIIRAMRRSGATMEKSAGHDIMAK